MRFDYTELKRLIRKRCLTVKDLADEVGFSKSCLYHKLENDRGFRQEEIVAICRYLKIPARDVARMFFMEDRDDDES